ncbi:MAG: universal stress protein [Gammaproteobacteria bacterium]
MYSRILVAVDDSDISKLALREAIKLTQDQQAKLRIVYVADEFIAAGEGVAVDFKQYEETKRNEGQNVLNEMIALTHKEKIDVESHLVEIIESNDSIPGKIIEEAEKWHADLIILGTHGRSGIPRLLLGSVAEEVMRKSQIPVHIVKGEE